MATPVLPGTSGLECTVIVGPEFQCSASPNGSITIQTNTGPIIIFLHRIADQRRIQINPVHQQRIPVVPFLSETSTSQTTFWFAENSGSADTQQENSNDLLGNPFSREQRNAEAFNSTANELEEGIHASLGGDEYTYHSVSSSGSFKKISSGKRSKPLSSDEELKEFCRKLSTKTLEQWKSRHKDDQSLKVLLSDWNTIFGQINYSSPGQWSYQTIIKAETLGGLHLPFHKMILATWWNSCLERRTSEVTARIKKQMVLALEPGFDSFDAKVQDSKRKQIDRCILQGNVITLMFNRAPGLVITAARSIKTTEYEILWKNKLHPSVSMLDWLSEELIKDSQLYLEPVLTILHFLSKIFNIQPQSPNPQANFSLPQSRIEPESQTDAASSSCRAIHSLKEPVPSYQISLCGQQPSEDSIETIANTAKRRKISSNICLQSPKVCPILIPESNGGTTQEESQHYSTDPSIHREHYNLAPLFEGASNSEPISEDIEVGQWSAISSVNRADYDKDTNLPSYGLSDLLGHVETSYCFGKNSVVPGKASLTAIVPRFLF